MFLLQENGKFPAADVPWLESPIDLRLFFIISVDVSLSSVSFYCIPCHLPLSILIFIILSILMISASALDYAHFINFR